MYNRYDQRRIQEEQQRDMGKQTIFFFNNPILKDLWEHELVGQISDGMWENTANTGWIFWCNIKSEIGDATRIDGNVPCGIKRNFAFTRLIEYVGDRMLETIQKYEPNATEKDLKKYLKEISNAMKATAIV